MSNRQRLPTLAFLLGLLCTAMPAFSEVVDARKAMPQRTLNFPVDRSLGIIHTILRAEWETAELKDSNAWKRLGEARGEVLIPEDHVVQLSVSREAARDLSPLTQLPPDAIYLLSLWKTDAKDDALVSISHLTGLNELNLDGSLITNEGVKRLAPLKSLKSIGLGSTEIGDAGVQALKELPALESVGLAQTRITDKALEHLGKMPQLRILSLEYTDIGDAGVEHLQNLAHLKQLGFWKNNITDGGVAHLMKLRELTHLTLGQLPITDAALTDISRLQKLKSLRLDQSKLTDAGLKPLSELPTLESLTLPLEGLTDATLESVSRIQTLKELHIGSGNAYTDAGLAHLMGSSLEMLDIGGEGITDTGVATLMKIPTLRTLWLQSAGVTDAGLKQLAALPELKSLLLNATHCTWEGLSALAQFPKLDSLDLGTGLKGPLTFAHLRPLVRLKEFEVYLRDPGCAAEELSHLQTLVHLEHLDLSGELPLSDKQMQYFSNMHQMKRLVLWPKASDGLTDAGLRHLAGMQRLEYLQLSGRITDAGLEHLAKLGSLRYLNLNTRTVTNESLAVLRKELPSLQSVSLPTGPPLKDPPQVGDAAPPLVVETFDGKTFDLKQQRGKLVLLYFWGTWCGPCVAGTPRLKEMFETMSDKYGERFVMLSLSFNEEEFLPKRHAERQGLAWAQAALGEDSTIQSEYGVGSAPTYVLVGPGGKIASTVVDVAGIHRVMKESFPEDQKD